MTPRWSVSRRRVRPEERLLPLLERYPEVWAVLRRHGVGYRGRPGPSESIAAFAVSRQLDPGLFRDECSAIVRTQAPSRGATEGVGRAYLIGGAALLALTGVVWVAWLLSRLAMGQPPGLVDLPRLHSCAEFQACAFLDLLCMGLVYAVLPRVWRVRLAVPWVSGLVLGLMSSALSVRVMVLVPAPGGSIAMLGSVAAWLQLVAVSLFATQLVLTLRRSRSFAEPITGFLMIGVAWLLASSALLALSGRQGLAGVGSGSLGWSSPFREPLRAMQVHGLALSVSLGLSLALLPRSFSLPAVSERRAWWALDLITTAVLAEVLLSMALEATGNAIFLVGLWVSWLMLAAGAGLPIWTWRPWRAIPGSGVCGRFVRGAFAWLALALVLLVLEPVMDPLGVGGPAGSRGGARLFLGLVYLTLLLMGVATRSIAASRDRDPAAIPGLAWIFWLVNAAAGIRLLAAVAGRNESAFPLLAGASASFWLIGVACWGVVALRLWRGADVPAEAVSA